MSHLWPLKPARAYSHLPAGSPASSHHCLSLRGCSSCSIRPWAPGAVVTGSWVLWRSSRGSRSTWHLGAARTTEDHFYSHCLLFICQTEPGWCEHLPRRSCSELHTARSGQAEQRLQPTCPRRMCPAHRHSRTAARTPIPAPRNLVLKLACSSSGSDTQGLQFRQQPEREPCLRGASSESPV